MNSCVICGGHGVAWYPLLSGSPTFCHSHYNQRDAGPFGVDLSGPDDFDVPVPEFKTWRDLLDEGTWLTREGEEVQVEDMGDTHLRNTIALLERQRDRLGDFAEEWIARLSEECERRAAAMAREEKP